MKSISNIPITNKVIPNVIPDLHIYIPRWNETKVINIIYVNLTSWQISTIAVPFYPGYFPFVWSRNRKSWQFINIHRGLIVFMVTFRDLIKLLENNRRWYWPEPNFLISFTLPRYINSFSTIPLKQKQISDKSMFLQYWKILSKSKIISKQYWINIKYHHEYLSIVFL